MVTNAAVVLVSSLLTAKHAALVLTGSLLTPLGLDGKCSDTVKHGFVFLKMYHSCIGPRGVGNLYMNM